MIQSLSPSHSFWLGESRQNDRDIFSLCYPPAPFGREPARNAPLVGSARGFPGENPAYLLAESSRAVFPSLSEDFARRRCPDRFGLRCVKLSIRESVYASVAGQPMSLSPRARPRPLFGKQPIEFCMLLSHNCGFNRNYCLACRDGVPVQSPFISSILGER